MKYKVNELAKLSGISPRALRYYNQIGLLMPEKVDLNGYRIYGQAQVDKLQQILFYRELGVALEDIKQILSSSDYDGEKTLECHLSALQKKKEQIEILIQNVSKTICSRKEGIIMSDKEKFEGFKQEKINENEALYGKEIRNKYGDELVNSANTTFKSMSKEQWQNAEELSSLINQTLLEAFVQGDPSSDVAQRACDLHRQWLCMFWKEGTYSKEAHNALADGYVADKRFTAYYDKIGKGCTKFFRDAIAIYCSK